MKINKFLLFFLIIFTNNILNSFANEGMMQKGLEIFNGKGQCAACHTLKAAESQGNIGPNLDQISITLDSVKRIVINGQGVMPALGLDGTLNQEEIESVSYFVVNSVNN
tara:strand:- start:494 stop:820 length:327 start_codon:yes stop_codon:yes gene_type:complete